jgi:mono/diheme cytochrome c family protein
LTIPGNIVHALLASSLILTAAGCSEQDGARLPRMRPLTDRVFEPSPGRIERGRYLTEGVCQCFLCHSERDWSRPGAPPMAGMKGAGRIIREDSIRTIVAPNITPDPETGAGTWTDDMFARAIREGIGHDDRALTGPMWYWAFSNLSDEDLASIIVYLRTLPPVHNPLPKRRLSPREEQGAAEGPEPLYEPVPARDLSNAVERGRYLADIADCAGCHSAWEAPYIPGIFGGGNLLEEGGKRLERDLFSANITLDPSGIAYYDDSLFIEVMRTGRVRVRNIDAVMPWVVFQHMSNDDLLSLYAYLRTQPPVRHVVDNHLDPTYCAMCGEEHGEGEHNVSKLDTFEQIEIDSSVLDQYAGTYVDESYEISFRRKGNRLVGEEDGRIIELAPGPDTLFYAREFVGPISFVRGPDGRVTHCVSHEDMDYKLVRKEPGR